MYTFILVFSLVGTNLPGRVEPIMPFQSHIEKALGFVPDELFMPGEILFKLKNGVDVETIKSFAQTHNHEFVRATRKLGIHLIKFNSVIDLSNVKDAIHTKNTRLLKKYYKQARQEMAEITKIYEQSGLVEYAGPNHIVHMLHTPNDPFFVDCTSFPNDQDPDQYGLFRMHAEGGWDVTTGNPDVLIGYTDSGLDLDNVDIEDNVWTNEAEANGSPGVDDDGNGYVDDVHGWDFIGDFNGDPYGGGSPNEDNNPDVFQGDPACGDGEDNNMDGMADAGVAHGTMTSGTACCVIDNALGFAGGSGHCKVVMARVIDPEGGGTEATIAGGFEYLTAAGVDIINCSLGASQAMPAVKTAVDNAYNSGIAVICASGNDGSSTTMYPASYSSTFAVGASNSNDQRSEFSTYGSWLDVVAPGGDVSGQTLEEAIWGIYVISVADSIYFAGQGETVPSGSGDYVGGGAGTSFSSPYCAALAALVKSVEPSYTPDQIYQVIRDNAYDIPPSGFDNETGYGRIDYDATLSQFPIEETENSKLKTQNSKLKLVVYPNPGDDKFVVKYTISERSKVSLKVYDITGSLVKTLVDSDQDRGTHKASWDGNTYSGIYFFSLKIGNKSSTKKITIVK